MSLRPKQETKVPQAIPFGMPGYETMTIPIDQRNDTNVLFAYMADVDSCLGFFYVVKNSFNTYAGPDTKLIRMPDYAYIGLHGKPYVIAMPRDNKFSEAVHKQILNGLAELNQRTIFGTVGVRERIDEGRIMVDGVIIDGRYVSKFITKDYELFMTDGPAARATIYNWNDLLDTPAQGDSVVAEIELNNTKYYKEYDMVELKRAKASLSDQIAAWAIIME